MKINVLYNPKASGMNAEVLEKVRKELQIVGEVTLKESTYKGHIIDLIKESNETSDWIITLGGDGTFGEAFKGLDDVTQKANYTHISMGTANDTAHNFNLAPGNIDKSLELLKKAEETDVDMISVNDIPFGYVSALGAFSKVTYSTPAYLKKTLGKFGYYLFSGISCLSEVPNLFNPMQIRYSKNGEIIYTKALTTIVSNTTTFGGFKLYPSAKINDGLFEVTILKSLPIGKMNQILPELMENGAQNFDIASYPENLDTFQTDYLEISSDSFKEKESLNHDGDECQIPLEDDKLTYKVKKKLKMLLPR